MVLFSVITVTKNNPQGLARTRMSVEAQSCTDYEWIVIDGAVEADDGIYDAMNKGIDRAHGTYMIFMNAGDVFANPDVLARTAGQTGADFLYGDATEGGHTKPARHDFSHGMPTHHQAMFYRRGAQRYDTRYHIAADYKFTAQYMAGGSCTYLPFDICDFEQGGMSQRNTRLGRREQAQIRKELGISAPLTPFVQMLATRLKAQAPALYWWARSRLRTSRA